jgi:hypothetical protein
MDQKPKRRDVLAAVAAAGGLLVLGGGAPAAGPEPKGNPAGEWLYDGKEDQPCAIFQQGRVLLLVNEEGEWATGRFTEADKFTVKGWEEGLVGELVDKGKTINWSNGTTWKRP